MEVVLTFVKNYFVLMLIFYLLSYLTPKEAYQKYFHFFVRFLYLSSVPAENEKRRGKAAAA